MKYFHEVKKFFVKAIYHLSTAHVVKYLIFTHVQNLMWHGRSRAAVMAKRFGPRGV